MASAGVGDWRLRMRMWRHPLRALSAAGAEQVGTMRPLSAVAAGGCKVGRGVGCRCWAWRLPLPAVGARGSSSGVRPYERWLWWRWLAMMLAGGNNGGVVVVSLWPGGLGCRLRRRPFGVKVGRAVACVHHGHCRCLRCCGGCPWQGWGGCCSHRSLPLSAAGTAGVDDVGGVVAPVCSSRCRYRRLSRTSSARAEEWWRLRRSAAVSAAACVQQLERRARFSGRTSNRGERRRGASRAT